MLYNSNVDLVNDNVYKKIWLNSVHSFLRYGAKTLFLNQSRVVTLLQIYEKTMIYNTNVDLVNDDVYTKSGFILSIRSQDIE